MYEHVNEDKTQLKRKNKQTIKLLISVYTILKEKKFMK